jgi:hypothetical protein
VSPQPSRADEQDLVYLKHQIAMNQYEVDSQKVAAALIRKIELLKMAQLAISGPAGQIPQQDGLPLQHPPS